MMRGVLIRFRTPLLVKKHAMRNRNKGRNMKKLFALVSHSVKVAGKDSYKVTTASANNANKAGKAFLKLVFLREVEAVEIV